MLQKVASRLQTILVYNLWHLNIPGTFGTILVYNLWHCKMYRYFIGHNMKENGTTCEVVQIGNRLLAAYFNL
jgi:hypothetical protein